MSVPGGGGGDSLGRVSEPCPVIIDTDPGIDDLLAIWAALGSPLLDVLAVVSVQGNVDLSMAHRNLRVLVEQARRAPGGQQRTPRIGRGAARPLVAPPLPPIHDIHGDDGLGGIADRFPAVAAGDDDTPAQVLYGELLESVTEPVTLIALGPLTNVATLLAARPDLVSVRASHVLVDHDHGPGRGATFLDRRPRPGAARAPVDHVHAVATDELMGWVADAIGALDLPPP